MPTILMAAAKSATGLEDTGDDWFEEPMRRLCAALEDEAELHLAGRIRARGELQLILQNRLRLVDLWKREPEIDDETVRGPIIVTGLGRSGTTLLHELLACDPDNRPPAAVGARPHGPGRRRRQDPRLIKTSQSSIDWVATMDDEIKLMDEIVPAFTNMHENGGHLPTECIFAFRPPVLERSIHRALQHSELHDLEEWYRPDARPTTGTAGC